MPSPETLSPDRSPTRRSHAIAILAVIAATLIGTALRFWGLGARDFWFDESCTFIYVNHLFDWPFASSFLVESTNTPYYALLWVWSHLFGETETAYRSLSSLAGSLTIPIVGATAWRLRGALTGAFAAVLAAVHPLHVYYSREARAYALWVLVLSSAVYTLVSAAKSTRRRWWIAFGIAMLAALHTHYFSIYFLPCTAACVFIAMDRRRTLRLWAITTGVVALCFVPWIILAVLPAASAGGAAWVGPRFDPITAIPQSLWAMLPSGGYPAHLRGLSVASPDTIVQASWLVIVGRVVPLSIFVLIATCILLRRPRKTKRMPGREWMFVLFLSIGPLVLACLYATLVSPNYLVGRYDLVAWPAWIILPALLLDALAFRVRKGVMLSVCACAIWIGCSAILLLRLSSAPRQESLHRQRAGAIAALTKPGDVVITFSYDRDALLYYLHRAGAEPTLLSYPRWLDDQIGWVDTAMDMSESRRAAGEKDAEELATEVLAYLDTAANVFLLADSSDPKGEGPREKLHARFVSRLRAAGIEIVLVDPGMLVYQLRNAK